MGFALFKFTMFGMRRGKTVIKPLSFAHAPTPLSVFELFEGKKDSNDEEKKPRKIFARKFQVLRLSCSSGAEFLTQAYSSEKCLMSCFAENFK